MATARLEQWQSLKVLVPMVLGTNRGTWWADPEFGSDLWLIRQEGKVDQATAGKVKREIERALAWFVSDGLVSETTVTTWQAGKNRIDYLVVMTKPDGGEETVEGVWYGL
jgi:phage gp46-like protein